MDIKRREELLAGAVGGLAGAIAMGIMMVAGKKMGLVNTPPPLAIEQKVEARLDLDERTTAQQERMVAAGGHLLMGVFLGAGYGLARSLPALRSVPGGAVYGMGVYAANFAGIGPALDLTAGPWNKEPVTAGRRLMMHLLFGVVTATVTGSLTSNRK